MTIAYTLTERVEQTIDGANGTGSTIAAKIFVTGYRDAITVPAATTDAIYGVTRQSIADGKHGSIMKAGKAIVTAGTGGVTAGQRVMPEAGTGKAITWTSAHSVGGIAQTTAAADADIEVELGLGATGA